MQLTEYNSYDKEIKMETSEKIIFLQLFPDAQPMAMLEKAEELSKATPADSKIPALTFEDMLRRIEERYTYEPKPDAEKKSEQFIAQAIAVCREFEIDTAIYKRSSEIVAVMDLYCGWHDSTMKCALVTLLNLANDFTLSLDKCKPEYVRISISHHTHNIYVDGKRREWW